MYYISDSHALLLLRYGDLIVSWFIHSFIPSIHPMLNGQRSLIYDNILLLCSTFLCKIAWYGIRCGAGTWWKAMKMLYTVPNVAPLQRVVTVGHLTFTRCQLWGFYYRDEDFALVVCVKDRLFKWKPERQKSKKKNKKKLFLAFWQKKCFCCLCTYICIHIYLYVYVYICTNVYVYMCVQIK